LPPVDRIFGAFGDPTRRAIVARLTAARDGRTLMMLRHERLINLKALDNHRRGWTGSLDKLAASPAGPAAR
jgi:hypothetical protein